jgi:hypothetical protein
MTDAHTIRLSAGEFDYLPPLVLRSEDELVAYLDDWAGSPDWHGDSLLGPDGYAVAVYCERPTDWRRVADLLSYIWQGPMRGEWDEQTPEIVYQDHLFVFALDTTKSQRDDVSDAWHACKGIISEGTPVRKTDKAGPGTAGTRKHPGVGPVLIAWR